MLVTYGIIAVLVILIVAVLVLVLLAWYLRSSSGRSSAKTNIKTQPVVQRFVSSDLRKRAFVVQLNTGGYRVVCQRYSDKVINSRGDVTGWWSLPEKPVSETLAGAVEIAEGWVHAED